MCDPLNILFIGGAAYWRAGYSEDSDDQRLPCKVQSRAAHEQECELFLSYYTFTFSGELVHYFTIIRLQCSDIK